MTRVLNILFLFVSFSVAEPSVTFEKTVRYQDEVSGHSIEVMIHQGLYDFSGHKISGGESFPVDEPPEEFTPATIDGVEIAGTEGMNPFTGVNKGKMVQETIRDVALKWDDAVVDVPKALHVNLMGLTLAGDFGWNTIQFLPNSTGDVLLIQATGGDGGASYMVSLILRKDGKHQQIYHGYWEDELPSEEEAWELIKAEQDGADQPATAPESNSDGKEKPQPESEGHSQ